MPAWLAQEDGVTTSVNGKSRAWDNITIEHLWRTLKTEEVYLKKTGAKRPILLDSPFDWPYATKPFLVTSSARCPSVPREQCENAQHLMRLAYMDLSEALLRESPPTLSLPNL